MKRLGAALVIGLAACQQNNPEENAISSPEPPPALALAPMRGTAALDKTLEMLETELEGSLSGDLNTEREGRLLRAEAITDRLLETHLPFAWLNSRAYAVEPMLRQIQALADRVLAARRSGMRDDLLRRDMVKLRDKVKDLRLALRAGGGLAPTPLDSLLAAYPADSVMLAADPNGE